jgi:hypothetical protein
MSNIQYILFLFILLVVVLSSGIFFKDFLVEGFHSSSSTERGQGIGDSYAAPLDLPLNTDNTTFYNNTYTAEPTFFGFPRRRT